MKNILLLLFVPFLVFGQENQKAPVYDTSYVSNLYVPENLDLPSSQWSDLADTSWYVAGQDNFNISTAEEFAGIAELVAGGESFSGTTFQLTNNLDLGAHLWSPIGTGVDFPFSGSFDGNNYTISNLYINLPENDFVGMFGHVVNGLIQNIKLDTAEVYGSDSTGTIVANVYTSEVYNCHANNVVVVGTEFNIGGLSGAILSGSTMTDCSATNVNVSGGNQVGGLLGSVWDSSTLKRSYSTGVASGGYIIGGLIGFTTFAFTPGVNLVEDCYSRVNVSAEDGRAGGFYGTAQASVNIKNAYSTGTATAPEFVGGFIGSVGGGIQTINTYFDFETSGHLQGIGGWEAAPGMDEVESRSSESMKTEAFVSELNVDSNDNFVWFMGDESNDFYPMLTDNLSLVQAEIDNADIQIYPNPVKNELHLKSNQVIQNIDLYNVNGQLLKSMKSIDKINVTDLSKGVYVIKITTSTTVEFKKFIKK